MRYLVTGGAGFIGSNFIRFVLDERPDAHVVNLDALSYAGNLENLADVMDDVRHTLSTEISVIQTLLQGRSKALI